jgi:hypothetical protein
MAMKNIMFWYGTSCSIVEMYRCFGWIIGLRLESVYEFGGNAFLRSFSKLLTNCTTALSRRWHSSLLYKINIWYHHGFSVQYLFLTVLHQVDYVSLSNLTMLWASRQCSADDTIIDERGAAGETEADMGNLRTGTKHVLVSLCSPEIVHVLTWDQTRAFVVWSQKLTARSMAWPNYGERERKGTIEMSRSEKERKSASVHIFHLLTVT